MKISQSLFCDIDSTINNHRERIKRNTIGGWPGTEIHPKAFTRKEVMKDKPLRDAVSSLKKLSKVYSINFITSRSWDPDASTTKDWLDLHGFEYNSITIVNSHYEKLKILEKEKPDLYIDDFTIHQERKNLTLLEDLISVLPVPYEIFNNNWDEIVEKYLRLMPNGEYFFEMLRRNLQWWSQNVDYEKQKLPEFHNNFLSYYTPDFEEKRVGEIGPGALGGLLYYPNINPKQRVFIDVFMNGLRSLHLHDWVGNTIFINSAAESIPLQDNFLDLIVSYNALDHGWNIFSALGEAYRVAKEGFIAFDCKGNGAPPHDRLDHYQEVYFDTIKKFVLENFNNCSVQDLTKTNPNFKYLHNWGFPVAVIRWKK
jgi:hypothetical protein